LKKKNSQMNHINSFVEFSFECVYNIFYIVILQINLLDCDIGISGRIYVNANGEREMDIILMDFDPGTGNFQVRDAHTHCCAWLCFIVINSNDDIISSCSAACSFY
jgi:hypothetical protein